MTTDVQLIPKEFIKDNIQKSLEASLVNTPTYDLIKPTQEEINHVSILFKDRKLDNIAVIDYKLVSDIGRKEFNNLNTELKKFTSKITEVKSPGIFNLLTILTKNVEEADLPGIWEKTVNAKPSLGARFKALFNKEAIGYNLQTQYQEVYKLLTEKSKGLEVKLLDIERKLIQQKHEQENNITSLQSTFEMYFNSFEEVRKQFIFTLYLEEFYKQELTKYKEENKDSHNLHFTKQLSEYESIFKDIENKKLILQGALIKFPITVKQNEHLIGVCKNILKEIDNTLLNSFTNIRSNLMSLGISLNAQQGLLGTNSAKILDEQSAKFASKIAGKLAVEAEKFAGDSRLREAETIKRLVEDIKLITENVNQAKIENEISIQKAHEILNESAIELRQILGQT